MSSGPTDPFSGRPPALVALRAAGLGDLLTAVPALHALRDAFPKHRRYLATSASYAPLVELIGGYELLDVAGRSQLPDIEDLDVAVNLHGSGPQSHRALLALHPRALVAFASPGAFDNGPPWQRDEHEVHRWCRLLDNVGIAADPTRLGIKVPLDDRRLGGDDVTIVHPGAASPARRWPPDRFAAVCRAERALGRRVLITGTKSELRAARRVAIDGGVSRDAVLAGTLPLRELVALIGRAGRVVCGDSGIAHLATATGTPSVVLFGPTSPACWGPPADRPQHVSLWTGHRGDPHGMHCDPGLLELTVDDVCSALAQLPCRPWHAGADLMRRSAS
ncbi:MAG TPA: glycosyltransferase family 9 protein [Acidimicrobiia bacterium]|jgi:ADP-heptose:LPS heptosyltransferase|nr:glycosyltransferase family 9 protein [Acidimicrobiia bacterium]